MANRKTIKKRGAIILLIAAFSFAGIVSCKGASITGSESAVRSDDFIEMSELMTMNSEVKSIPSDYPYPDDTIREIYVPFVSAKGNIAEVSYMDTNSLNCLWKGHISRVGSNDNIRWIIRDGYNREKDPRNGNYYYFDKNADINYVHQTDNENYKIRLKEFVGGVIVRYSINSRGEVPKDPVYTIGGLYRYLLNREGENSKKEKGYTKYNNSPLNEFMREIHNWGEGDLTVILMNQGYATKDSRYSFKFNYELGVDEYYCTVDNNYRKDPSYFIGQNPTNYLGTDNVKYWHEKLNVRVNHSHYLGRYNFKFTMAEALDGWL